MPKTQENTGKPGVVLILGEDRFLAGEAVRAALEGAGDGDGDVARYRGNEVKLGAVLDEVRTPGFFGGGRTVLVEEADPLLDIEGLDALAAYAERPVGDALLVVQAKKIDGRRAGAKKLKAAARVTEVSAPPEWKLSEWVSGQARRQHGLQAGRDAADALLERIGADLGALDRALDRLRIQIAPRDRLTAADVLSSTEDHRSPSLFEATNAVESGDLPKALAAVDAAFREGLRLRTDTVTEAQGIALILLSQIHGAYRKLVRFHMLRRESNDEEAARGVGISPRAARFFVNRAKGHRLEHLVERHGFFVEADKSLKTGALSPRRTISRLLVGLFT